MAERPESAAGTTPDALTNLRMQLEIAERSALSRTKFLKPSASMRIAPIRERLRQLEDGLNVLREAVELSRIDPPHAPAEPGATARLFAAHLDAAIAAVRREIQHIDGAPRVRRNLLRSLALAAGRCGRWFRLLRTRRKFLDGK
jgi:hypothetical protein